MVITWRYTDCVVQGFDNAGFLLQRSGAGVEALLCEILEVALKLVICWY